MIGGHHFVAFLAKLACPAFPLWVFMKYTMASDTLAAICVWLGLEHGAVDYAWLEQPPESTRRMIAQWKASGQWLPGVDPERGVDGFHGFHGVGPAYYDISWSHSLALSLALGAAAAAYHRARGGASAREAAWVFACTVSHVCLDLPVHDVYVLPGSRARTRVSLRLWRSDLGSALVLLLEIALPAAAFERWRRSTEPVHAGPPAAAPAADAAPAARRACGCARAWGARAGCSPFARWACAYWAFVLLWADLSWYALPQGARLVWPAFHLGENARVAVIAIFSWVLACYPCYRMEQLRVPREGGGAAARVPLPAGGAADKYAQLPPDDEEELGLRSASAWASAHEGGGAPA